MIKKKYSDKPEIKKPKEKPEVKPSPDPEEPLDIRDDDPDVIPDEDPFENSPAYEKPAPGEGP